MSKELEKCTRNGKQTQQSLPLRHWCCSSASPCDCSPGIFLLCREDGKKEGKKSQHHCCKRYSSPEKSCHQPAEEITEQTLLNTRNTSSLSVQPLSVKAKVQGLCCVPLAQGMCCAWRLSLITGQENCPFDDQPLQHVAKLTGLWSSTYCRVGQVTKRHIRDSSTLPKLGTCFPPHGTNSLVAEQFHQCVKNVHCVHSASLAPG